MSFDISKTFALVKGGILDSENTWSSYLGENPSWQQTAMNLTGPLILANVVLSLVLSRLVGGFAYYGLYGSFLSALIMGLVMAVLGFFIAVLVFNFLAGPFKGKPDFSRAFAAVSLAAIPAWIAGIIGALIPWVGFLIAIAGAILSLVYLYKVLPLALDIPGGSRLVHFIVSLVVIIVINMVIGGLLGRGMMDSNTPFTANSRGESTESSTRGSGVLGEIQRQAELMNQATSDVFEPPEDGMLKESQVEAYAAVLRKTKAMHEKYAEEMKRLSEEMEAKEEAGETPSVADISKMYGGVGKAMGANNAEMEIVKTAGGNWAEHLWVKQQLRIASIQQGEGSEAIAHNYALYQKFEDQL